MLRLEAFGIMQKDNNKRFRSEGFEYFVNCKRMFKKRIGEADYHGIIVDILNFEDSKDYVEDVQPLWETIKNGDVYYTPRIHDQDLVARERFNRFLTFHVFRKEKHLMFKTKEEAIAAANKMLELFK